MLDSLNFLDAPRQSVWNAGRGLSDLFSGKAPDWNDIAPAIGGVTMGAGALAGGMGLPLSVLMGSILGGFGQEMIGNKAMDPSEFTGNTGTGLALQMATDPLTWASGGMGLGLRGARNAERAGLMEARLGKTLGADEGHQAINRLGQEVDKFRNYTPDLSPRMAELPPHYGAPSFVDPAIAQDKITAIAPDILKGMVPQGHDLGSLSQMLEQGGMDAGRMEPVMRTGGTTNLIDALKMNPPEINFPPKLGKTVAGDLPSIEGMHLSQQSVPLDPSQVVEMLQRRPEVLDMLAQQAKGAEWALSYRPVRYPGQPGLRPGQHHLGLDDEILGSYGTAQTSPMFEPRHNQIAEMIAQLVAQAH